MAPSKSADPLDLLKGGILQCCEAASVGMPFEVWKTHMGTYRSESTVQAFKNIYQKGGVGAFWNGWQPKMIESFLKGGVLMYSKEAIIRVCVNMGIGDTMSGVYGGFGGGVSQVVVMGPCTFLVTAAVTGNKSVSMTQRIAQTFASQGVGGFYRGGTALMLRQGTNWASRQGFTDAVRNMFKSRHSDPQNAKLSVLEETLSGVVGGALSTWNQPFEVLRIEAQASGAKGLPPKNIVATCAHIVKEAGVLGLFQGLVPRIGLGIAQTFFMVTVPYILKPYGLM